MEDLKSLVVRLDEHGCRFVLVGGFCAVSLGCSMVTRDVDVVCDFSPENLVRIWEALEGLHPVHRMTEDRLPFTREQAESATLRNAYLTTSLGQLDLLGEVTGIGNFESCLEQSEVIVMGTTEIRALTLEALIMAKRAMGRPRDLHTVLELEMIREERGKG